jgi:uncharacterized protein (TIGR02246 family)
MVRTEIEQANRGIGRAFNSGDTAAVAAFYTENATVLPPNSQMIRGRKAIEDFWKSAMAMGIRSIQLTTLDVESSGDMAYEIGNATLEIRPDGGTAASETIKYVVVWKRQPDNSWKLAADIWNSVAAS